MPEHGGDGTGSIQPECVPAFGMKSLHANSAALMLNAVRRPAKPDRVFELKAPPAAMLLRAFEMLTIGRAKIVARSG